MESLHQFCYDEEKRLRPAAEELVKILNDNEAQMNLDTLVEMVKKGDDTIAQIRELREMSRKEDNTFDLRLKTTHDAILWAKMYVMYETDLTYEHVAIVRSVQYKYIQYLERKMNDANQNPAGREIVVRICSALGIDTCSPLADLMFNAVRDEF